MKIFKTICTLIALIAVTGMSAQKINKQVTKEVMIKNFTVDQGDRTIEYTLKIDNKETGYVTMEKSDRSKKEQDRIPNPVKVTKVISIDNDLDPNYDNVIELTYLTKEDEHFTIDQTEEGFVISVVGKQLRYNFLKRDYNVIKKDADTFEVVMVKTK